jgi:hypothetical protein
MGVAADGALKLLRDGWSWQLHLHSCLQSRGHRKSTTDGEDGPDVPQNRVVPRHGHNLTLGSSKVPLDSPC